jgi:hypothetical protein
VAILISNLANIPTIISPMSIIVSFGISSFVGLVFGLPGQAGSQSKPYNLPSV